MNQKRTDRTWAPGSGPRLVAVGSLLILGGLAFSGLAVWKQSRIDEEQVERRTRSRLEPRLSGI